MTNPARRLSRTNRVLAEPGARRGRTAVCRSVTGEAHSAASAATVIALKDSVSGSSDRTCADQVIPSQMAPAPPRSSRLAASVSRTAGRGSRSRLRLSRSGPMRRSWVTPRITITQPVTVWRQSARACRTSVSATNPSRSAAPAGVRSRNAPGRGASSAPSERGRSDTGAIDVGNESSTWAMAAPAAARERTCSTATAPTRRPSPTAGPVAAGEPAPPPAGSLLTIG